MMKPRKRLSAANMASSFFEGVIRSMVGCFVLIIAVPLLIGLIGYLSNLQFGASPPKVGPRAPIPQVDAGTLTFGQSVYQRENCGACHTLTSADPQKTKGSGKESSSGVSADASNGVPNLTHEGRRNADIDWQMINLREHQRMYPNSIMGDYKDLSPRELKALASYLATRR